MWVREACQENSVTPPRRLPGFSLQTPTTHEHSDKHPTSNFADQGAETQNGNMLLSITLCKQTTQHLAQVPALGLG